MAKKKEKSTAKEEPVQTAEGYPDDEEVGDDNSPEAYPLTGDYVVDFNEICKRSDLSPVVLKARAQTPSTETEGSPTTYVTKDKYEYLKPCIEIENDDENKSSIKSFYIKGWIVDVPLLNVLSLAAPQSLTSISLWRCGLNKESLDTLITILSKLSVKYLNLDGNPDCAGQFHLLLNEDSTIGSLSLRSNKITCDDIAPFAAALSTNKTLTNLALYNNVLGDAGVAHIAKGLRMNRTLLTLNLSNNKLSDAGAKSLADILTTLCLTHEEIVARRTLISENKSSLLLDDSASVSSASHHLIGRRSSNRGVLERHKSSQDHKPPTTPGGRTKDRPGSNSRTGSHTALDKNKNKGASGKGSKKQDKLDKPGAKDGRKSEQGNKGKDDKRKGGGAADGKSKSKVKGVAGKKNQEEKEQEPEIVEFQNPLLEPNESEVDGKVVVPGDYALTCLNLNNNNIGNHGIGSLYKAVQMQENRTMKRGIRGLLRLTVKNNKFDAGHRYATELTDLMIRRDPFYEQPLLEEEQSNMTTNT